jgi:hypothetical protein
MRRIPDISKFRRVLFWDTKIESIDWQRQKKPLFKEYLKVGIFLRKKRRCIFMDGA